MGDEIMKFKLGCLLLMVMAMVSNFQIYQAEARDASKFYSFDNQAVLKNKLLYLKGGDIWIADLSKRSHKRLTDKKDVTNYSISYDLTRLVFVRNFNKLYEIDLTKEKEKYISDLKIDMSNPSISPANDKIVYVSKSLKDFSPYPSNKAYKEKVRHIWIIDLKSMKKIDLTEESSNQYSAPKWSPDGRRISFTSGSWDVYVKNMTEPGENVMKVGAGYYSEWINQKTLAVGGPEIISVYNIEEMKKISEIKIQPAFHPAKFSFGTSNRIYYEDQTENPDIDISCVDATSVQERKVIVDARSPIFVK
jgi:dipeptidyl aminopeptidase/acylaminoacyl peptidase